MRIDLVKKLAIAAVLIGALGGCSVSPTVDAASLTVGSVSFLLTGKNTVDHAVSAMAGQDCAMIRMAKNESVCVPRDEDVVGDRLVFAFEKFSWSGGSADAIAGGDPLSVSPAIGDVVQPLGAAVLVESRASAIAAVAADPAPLGALMSDREPETWTSVLSGLVKDKAKMPVNLPDRATRLWLPVE